MNEIISIPCGNTSVRAYVSVPDPNGKFPALILIEEIWGVDGHIKEVSDRYAKEGFVVVAPELLDESGILEKMSPEISAQMQSGDEAVKHAAQPKMREALAPIYTKAFADRTIAKLKACVDYATAHKCSVGNVGCLGFCFGGTYAFELAIRDPRIKAAVPFYGRAPEPLDSVAGITAPVLAFYGEQDTRLAEKLPQLVQAMKDHGRDFSYMLYPHTGHAFFNDTRAQAYNEDAARDAWEKSLAFLHKNLDA